MEQRYTGKHTVTSTVGGEVCRAFIPYPLPPDPPVQIDGRLQELLGEASVAVGRLDGITDLLPDPALFLYFYLRKEAVLSSQIEGTQSTLSELLLFEIEEAGDLSPPDAYLSLNYVAAMNHGLQRLRGGVPLCGRLLREMHAILLQKGRGSEKEPGEFRTSQNWIGGNRPGNAGFIPPPPEEVPACMVDLDRFLNDEPERVVPLLKAAFAHAQFETIHPFLDGNGRLGRLLITLILCHEGVLSQPMLFLSLYLKNHRLEYYDLLQGIRLRGDWESWVAFFLQGIKETAKLAVETARNIEACSARNRQAIQGLGRSAGSALRVHEALRSSPIANIAMLAQAAGVSSPTAATAIDKLAALGIVNEITGKQRNQLFAYTEYLQILDEGTEPLRTP